MCDPTLILTLGSTVLGAAGQIQQAQAASSASKYNAQVADMNAQLADRKAKDDVQRGAMAEQQKRAQTAQLQGRQRASMAANGVDLSFGSPLDTLVDTAQLGELDALNIRSNAYREAYDDKVNGVNQRSQATLDRMQADNATTGGYLSAAGTVLTGASKGYTQYKSPGGIGYIGN